MEGILHGILLSPKKHSSVESFLFHHSYAFVGDVDEGIDEIVRFDGGIIDSAPKVNVFMTTL